MMPLTLDAAERTRNEGQGDPRGNLDGRRCASTERVRHSHYLRVKVGGPFPEWK